MYNTIIGNKALYIFGGVYLSVYKKYCYRQSCALDTPAITTESDTYVQMLSESRF